MGDGVNSGNDGDGSNGRNYCDGGAGDGGAHV